MSLSNERLNLQELQNDLDRETSSLQELEAQKQDAQDRLDEMDQQKAKLKDMLSDVGQKCQEETQVVSERVEGSRLAVRASRTSTLMERWLGDEQPQRGFSFNHSVFNSSWIRGTKSTFPFVLYLQLGS